ncbi:MAG: RNA-guided endonuclease TnpB family protein, partial [Cyanobacteria bacterium P01_H01_bin.152]
ILNDRDDNAAKNIKAVGASTAALGGDVRRAQPAVAV